ncbi:DNA-directed RNA polymerase subunit delta [Salirhabdus sp. Marseille-P4669]|uniref:DNA-directed RNA polymerase subunit delta n=1 Tax=Salirhabdus sp. Marseille-P4669 TaxID=2042310 RepID=UPI000C79884D|nr:DNA-directed RNA polymerase subunit delta [Salirhabdus sp. Marseille-P4669]
MSLENYTQEELAEMSMLEIAAEILFAEKKAINIHELYDMVAEKKGFTEEQKNENIAQFYTDLNVDGRFVTLGSNLWGLKRWYPVDTVEEELTHSAPKKKKKKAKKKVEEDFDEIEEEEEDFDLDDEDLDEDLDDDIDADDIDDDLDDDDIDDDDDDEDLDFDDDEEEEDFDFDEEDDEESDK